MSKSCPWIVTWRKTPAHVIVPSADQCSEFQVRIRARSETEAKSRARERLIRELIRYDCVDDEISYGIVGCSKEEEAKEDE